MKRANIPNKPERGDHFELDKGRFARVIYKVERADAEVIQLHVQAFEVDAQGNLREIEHGPMKGAPSRTGGTITNILRSGIGDTVTVQPGWVRVVGNYSPDLEIGSNLPTGTRISDTLPLTGEVGDHVWLTPREALFRWDVGEIAKVLEAKAWELQLLVAQSEAMADLGL